MYHQIFLACIFFVFVGCDKAPKAGTVSTNTSENPADKETTWDLKRFGLAIHNYWSTVNQTPFDGKMPESLEVVKKFMGDGKDNIIRNFETGKYKVFWSAPKERPFLACEKDAETRGGLVLTRIGAVERMSAEEIKKALEKK